MTKRFPEEVQFYLSKPKAYQKYMTDNEKQYIFPTPKRTVLKLVCGTIVAFVCGLSFTVGMNHLWSIMPQIQFLISFLASMAVMLIEVISFNYIRRHYINQLYRKASFNVDKRFNHIPSDYTK